MKIIHFIAAAGIALAVSSCSSSKNNLGYFSDIRTVKEGTLPLADYSPTIKPDDELFINISSVVPEATMPYNLVGTQTQKRETLGEAGTVELLTYIVSPDGYINMPQLGKIKVEGLTTAQLSSLIVEKLSKEVADPIVTVEFVDFHVSVAGEVKTPGIVKASGNRLSILDALTAAGDLTEYGERSNVLVIREENGERKFAHLDLNSSDILNSPFYYLQQNDYVYVEPNKIKQENSKYNTNNSYKLSLTSTIVSAASVIASLVIALTVK